MIKSRDFVPEKKKGGLFKSGKIEDFQSVINTMNEWIEQQNNISVINVESVVLPNIHDAEEQGSEDTELWTGATSSTSWHQLIRLWYREG